MFNKIKIKRLNPQTELIRPSLMAKFNIENTYITKAYIDRARSRYQVTLTFKVDILGQPQKFITEFLVYENISDIDYEKELTKMLVKLNRGEICL